MIKILRNFSSFSYFFLISVVLLITLIVSIDTPNWTDDIMFIDPAASLFMGYGWHSSVWPSQSIQDFFWGNNQLYPLVIFIWYKIFGFSFISTKIFIFILEIFVVKFLYLVLRVMKINKELSLMILLFYIGSTWVQYITTHQRGEIIQIFFILLLLYLLLTDKNFLLDRRYLIFIISAIIFFSGIHSIVSVILVYSFILIYIKRDLKNTIIISILGFIFGFFIWTSIGVYHFGLLNAFKTTLASGYAVTGQLAQSLVFSKFDFISSYISRFSLIYILRNLFSDKLILILSIYYIFLVIFKKINKNTFYPFLILNFNIIVGILLFIAFGRFERYYYPLVLLPALIVYAYNLNKFPFIIIKLDFIKYILVLFIIVNSFTVFENIVPKGILYRQKVIKEFIKNKISPSDYVYVDPLFYSVSKEITSNVFSYTYGGGKGYPKFLYNESNKISKIICVENECNRSLERLGGVWYINSSLLFDRKIYIFYTNTP